jgi:hypothetical protein
MQRLLIGSVLLVSFFLPVAPSTAERLALLIGNQAYNENVGPLINPRKDIELVGAALKTLNFKTTIVPDGDFTTIEKAIKNYIARVRDSGPDAVSFFYYSGHGASDANTGLNYLIPIEIQSAEDTYLWDNSVELKGDLIDKLVTQAPAAIHFVVFDACRNELQLKVRGKKAFEVDGKGFVPVEEHGGILIAFATAPKKTATDAGVGGGLYARALAEELVRPGVEAVAMFRDLELRIRQSIGQTPWWNPDGLPETYLAGKSLSTPAALSQAIALPQAEKLAFERERASEKKAVQATLQQIGEAGIPSGGWFVPSKKWQKQDIVMCFLDGGRKLRAYVASVARQWTLYGEINFDFGSWDDPRTCLSAGTPHDVAITFAENLGNWSYLGTDSTSVPPDKPTLGLASVAHATEENIRSGKFNREILHEFGHALGFDHTWKAPLNSQGSSCDQEIDWDHVYTELGKLGWTRDTIDANLRSASRAAGAIGAFDRNSVINFEFPPSFFVHGRESPCYLTPLNQLSLRDKLAVFTIYK